MTSYELNKILIDKFPNLEERYLEEVSFQDGNNTGSHIVFGDVFTPYLKKCILEANKDEYVKMLNFIEELLNMKDSYVDEVVYFSIIENIDNLLERYKFIESILGKKSKEALKEIRKYYQENNIYEGFKKS